MTAPRRRSGRTPEQDAGAQNRNDPGPAIGLIDAQAVAGRATLLPTERTWDANEILRLATAGDVLFLGDGGLTECLIVLRLAQDEAEILDLGVAPSARRSGLATRLLAQAEAEVGRRGVRIIFLEVACDNDAARALYQSAGYGPVGVRKNYYLRAVGERIDALVLSKDLPLVSR